jgi:hypothetical protein
VANYRPTGAPSSRAIRSAFCWINERWFAYDTIMKGYRDWLAQLPADQAERIAHGNGEKLFVRSD